MGSGAAARPRWTWRGAWSWLVVLYGVIFLFQDVHFGDETLIDLTVPAGDAIDKGEVWRPLTSLLVHPGGAVHLGINTALLVAVGGPAERELGRSRFFLSYFAGGFSANALRYGFGGRTGGGASAAIVSVAGTASASWLHRSDRACLSDVAALVAVAGGSIAAATVRDNHVLALGVGGVIGHAAASSGSGRRFPQVLAEISAVGLAAMVGRIVSS